MKIETVFFLALLFVGCTSTRKIVTADRAEAVHTEIVAAQVADTQAQRVEREERVKVTEIVERITEAVDQQPIAPDTIQVQPESYASTRASPTRTIERTTRTFEGSIKAVEELVELRTADTLAVAEQITTTEAVGIDEEREDSTPRNLRWIGISAICVAVIFLLNFLKKWIK